MGPTVKPPTRPTKKKQETDELTRAMISFMAHNERGEKEQNEIDLALCAIGIRLKKSLNEEQIENAMDEINDIVTRHIKNARAKRFGIFRPSTSSDVVQQQQPQFGKFHLVLKPDSIRSQFSLVGGGIRVGCNSLHVTSHVLVTIFCTVDTPNWNLAARLL